jgi:hypothetical protein
MPRRSTASGTTGFIFAFWAISILLRAVPRDFDVGMLGLLSGTFRVVYLLKLKKAVYVIDAFQKKSKRGSQTPKEIRERLKRRIAEARRHDDESANGDQTE